MLLTSGLVVYGPLQSEKLDLGSPFAWHPILMGLGFNFLLSVGVWLYRYEDCNVDVLDRRAARRKIHVCIQLIGVILVGLGFVAIYLAHKRTGSALFMASNDPVVGFGGAHIIARTAHCGLGYLVLLLLVAQVFVGPFRYRVVAEADSRMDMDDSEGRQCSIHEKMGKVVYIFGLTNVLLGVWLYDAWSLIQRLAITLATVTTMSLGPRWDGGREMETQAKGSVDMEEALDRKQAERRKKEAEEEKMQKIMGRNKAEA